MKLSSILIAFCYSLFQTHVSGHSVFLTYPTYCTGSSGTVLGVGQTIMNANSVNDPQGRTIVVQRNGVNLASGAYYVAGETLNVTVSTYSKLNFEIVMQAKGML